jgi:hypothetical protein
MGSLLGCGPRPPVQSPDSSESNRILFLGYEIKKQPAAVKPEFRVVQQLLVDGSFTPPEEPTGNTDWMVFFLDEGNKKISQLRIPDPMIREVEGVDDAGKLIRKQVELERAELTIRINYQPAIKQVRIERKLQPGQALFQHILQIKQ